MLEYREQHKKFIRFFDDREVRTMWDEGNNKWYLTLLQLLTSKTVIIRQETIGSF